LKPFREAVGVGRLREDLVRSALLLYKFEKALYESLIFFGYMDVSTAF
jgi:hypothetical protein